MPLTDYKSVLRKLYSVFITITVMADCICVKRVV